VSDTPIYDRLEARWMVAGRYAPGDDRRRAMRHFLAEQRIAMSVLRPRDFVRLVVT
jgi:hypothetical protein